VLDVADVGRLRDAARGVYVDALLRQWIVALVRATRELDTVVIGSSVRGTLALESAARAWALVQGRDYVTPADVQLLFAPVLVHRIVFRPAFLAEVRRSGWPEAVERLREQCYALAPPPGA
jgi:MoxR-like ATPase